MEFITIAGFVLQILGISLFSGILIGILPFIIVFKMRKISKSLVYEFKKTKKYIPEIFVDINDTCEKLRQVVGGRKYRRRIRKEIKSLFTIDGRWLSKYWCVSHGKKKLKIPLAKKKLILFLEGLEKILDSKHGTEVFSNHREELSGLLDEKDEQYYIVYKFMQMKDSVGRLKESLILNTSKKLIITSTAGNGKSSLLSYTVDSLIKSFQPVLFLNSRTLGPSPLERLLSMLVNPRLKINFLTPIFFVIGVWNAIRGLPIVVVIDAINENDDDSFKTGLIDICEYFSGLPNYKVLMSCRNEYLEIRFHDLIEKLCVNRDASESSFRYDKEKSACMFSINNYYHSRDDYIFPYLDLLIDKYHKYFKAKKILPIREYTRLLNTSLLLFRFYFESEKNEIEESNRVSRYFVFRNYIQNVRSPDFCRIGNLLDIVGNLMVDQKNFDYVSSKDLVQCLGLPPQEKSNLYIYLDESLLLCHSLLIDEGTLIEKDVDIIHFTFDELRDYVLARIVLIRMGPYVDFKKLKEIIDEYFLKESESPNSCFEGVITYLYSHFRNENLLEIAEYIFNTYLIKFLDRENGNQLLLKRTLSENGMPLNAFEKNYVLQKIDRDVSFSGFILRVSLDSSYIYQSAISDWFAYAAEFGKYDNDTFIKVLGTLFFDYWELYEEIDEDNIVARIIDSGNNSTYSISFISLMANLLVYKIFDEEVVLSKCKKLSLQKFNDVSIKYSPNSLAEIDAIEKIKSSCEDTNSAVGLLFPKKKRPNAIIEGYLIGKSHIFIKDRNINLRKFLIFLNVRRRSYAEAIGMRIYMRYFANKRSLLKYYKNYYKIWFQSYEQFLKEKYFLDSDTAAEFAEGKTLIVNLHLNGDPEIEKILPNDEILKIIANFIEAEIHA